ncbi:ASCH domain-containing protein [Pseudomonas entomophila]|uniref:ASCH domain-containing protein n=1 Tax=Pseudomonas entomophila TaxID=312306 RepID=UPI0023D8035E|nr:ASCH domain-containing protein [Pseudomonas entomophila]MDF0733587.1 ASCH domain-containing protein [Pseudomonas entomophila]
MKALSIKQPWAWLIVHGGKDVENRTWHTKLRGRFLVHASQGMTWDYYRWAAGFARQAGVDVPTFNELERGGIIGSVELVDSVDHSDSPWYMGDKAFVLRDPKPLPFTPLKGQLQFFDVPEGLLP